MTVVANQDTAVIGLSSASYKVTVTKDGNGAMHASLSLSGLTGVDVTFDPSQFDFSPSEVTRTSTLTLTPAVGTPNGAVVFTVTALDQTNFTASGNGTVFMEASTQMVVHPVASAPGYTATFTALLETTDHTPLVGKDVEFVLDAGGPDATSLGTATTGADGWATFEAVVPAGLVLGSTHLIGASFAGSSDPYYAPCSNTANLTVDKYPTALAVSSVTGILGRTTKLYATLWWGVFGQPSGKLPSKPVTFYVDDTLVGTATTGDAGAASVNFVVPTELAVGPHTIKVTFDGSADPEYFSSEMTATLSVVEAPTALAVSSVSGTLGKSATLVATLWSGSSKVAGKELSFYVDDALVGTAVTNASGAASMSYPVPADKGTGPHAIKVTFDGSADPVYDSSANTSTLSLQKQLTVIAAASVSGTRGKTTTLVATLWAGSSRLAGRTLSFYVGDSLVGTASTNALGTASFSYLLPIDMATGVQTIKVTFGGDATYTTSEKTATLTAS